jgi:hypothetical protein
VHKLNLIEKEIENVPEEKTDDVIENVVRNDDSDESKTDSESDTKIIIDEDSTDNQFKLEL